MVKLTDESMQELASSKAETAQSSMREYGMYVDSIAIYLERLYEPDYTTYLLPHTEY